MKCDECYSDLMKINANNECICKDPYVDLGV